MRLVDEVVGLGVLPRAPAVSLVADDVAQMYFGTAWPEGAWNPHTDLGPMTPPFPAVWMEMRYPRFMHEGDEVVRLPDSERITVGAGILTERTGVPEATVATVDDEPGWRLQLGFVIKKGRTITKAGVDGFVFLDDSGCFTGTNAMDDRRVLATDEPDREMKELTDAILHPFLLALAFVNCRNVGLRDESPPSKVSAKHMKRTGLPLVRYTRIVLPSAASGATTKAEARNAVGELQPLHLVRGHFKTYTDDSPLFGKLTGTWWWDWQARGNQDQGVHVPTYEVSP